MASDRHTELLTAWLEGNLTDKELGEVFSEQEIARYRQILKTVDAWVPDEGPLSFDSSVLSSKKQLKPKTVAFNGWMAWSLAACMVIGLVTVFFILNPGKTTYSAEAGNIKELLLPDSSVLFLFAGSTVSWNESDWTDKSREVFLSGKAYLKVEKGSSFRVNTQNGVVEVLGTRFEVSSFEGVFQIQCYEGRVRGIVHGQDVIADPAMGFRFIGNAWEPFSVVSMEPGWLQNVSSFQNAPLIEVFKTLESVYGLTIQTRRVNLDRRFTGSFPNNDLALSLRIIFEPFGISYKLDGVILQLNE